MGRQVGREVGVFVAAFVGSFDGELVVGYFVGFLVGDDVGKYMEFLKSAADGERQPLERYRVTRSSTRSRRRRSGASACEPRGAFIE